MSTEARSARRHSRESRAKSARKAASPRSDTRKALTHSPKSGGDPKKARTAPGDPGEVNPEADRNPRQD